MCVNVIIRVRNLTLRKILWALMLVCVCFIIWTRSGITRKYTSEFKKADNPVIMWWSPVSVTIETITWCPGNIKCHVYGQKNINKTFQVEAFLFYASRFNLEDLPLPRKPAEIIWGLFHEESPRNGDVFLHEKMLKLFNYSSTLSRYSDIPFPLQHIHSFEDITTNTYFVKTLEKNHYLSDIAPVLYLQSDCETSTERDAYVAELMKFIHIDSYGSCLNNRKLDPKFRGDYLNHLSDNEFLHFVARYKFVIAIENGVCEDYITEKFWRAIKVGSVPIYFGSPSIRDWLPNEKSAILLEDFPTPEILSEHLNKLIADDKLYEEYLEHKVYGTVSNNRIIKELSLRPYQTDPVLTVSAFECFICMKLHERRQGIIEHRVIDKSHYNCPMPVSALPLAVNPENFWVSSFSLAEKTAESIYNTVMNSN